MADVARLAGVSKQTVSRVINGSPALRPATRLRVEAAIERLGYRPNVAARALVRGRTGVIGVISGGRGHFGPSSIQRGVEQAARDAGLFASSISLDEITPELLDGSIEHLRRQLVEGIVVIAGHDDAAEVARRPSLGVPVVLVEGEQGRTRWSVGVDQVAGGRLATRHLLGLGHREIAHVAGPRGWFETRGRLEGWRSELLAHDLRPREPVHVDWSASEGYAAGRELARDPSVTAVFAASDQIAMGVLRALHEAGRRVPEEVSVVGFDDLPETGYTIPPLTTVRQDFDTVGEAAVRLLTEVIDGRTEPSAPRVLPRLVVRASTATPHR
ncbi:DNA-binding transcriptional regulator, LacI/PurR family [Microlunatus flavus]|uniref:DNA-binding transcriptional regulator, LacI/PurR family n=2 Tax=Microlunatus flavus TaxID=1036181 RepID=A0A1H9D0Q5_9ACTN|nr:DNA-binding transcriptional regulator, LacI/PurR family [Microlunatus flavus]